jgi:hypothetical protein
MIRIEFRKQALAARRLGDMTCATAHHLQLSLYIDRAAMALEIECAALAARYFS